MVVNYNQSAGPAEEVVAAIRKSGGQAVAVKADVADAGAIRGLFDAAEKAFGPVTLLVNNAGVWETRPAAEVDLAHYEKLFHVNVRGPVLCMAEFARRVGSAGGRIVNISSGAARASMPGAGLYSGTKAALEGITRGFAADLGPQGVTVNVVAPGVTDTDMLRVGLPDEMKKHLIGNTALGRLGEPEDIADVVAFLCSDDSRWITGQFLDANGGLRF